MRYISQLDGLRSIAVILVIISHWFPKDHFLNILPNGSFGVQLFFVLSGYLITNILFRSRDTKNAIKNFYIRRTLRIFPIYYLTVFTLFVVKNYVLAASGTNISTSILYHLTYTSNIYFANLNDWDGLVSHLWSLSVEEQFYLIWPWFILFAPQRYLLHVIVAAILIGITSNLLFSGLAKFILLPVHFFAFGLGALLAWFETFQKEKIKVFRYFLKIISLFALALFAFSLYSQIIPTLLLINILSLSAVSWTIYEGQILSNRPMVFLGKISYGLYLYHNLIPQLITENIIHRYFPFLWRVPYATQFISAGILLVVATLSFYIIESPVNRLKKNFEYEQNRVRDPIPA